MVPPTKSLEQIIQYAETQIRIYQMPIELTEKHVYIRILAQKCQQGKTRFNNSNPITTVYEIIETNAFYTRNQGRFEYIKAYHQLRLFGYDLWIQTFPAKTLPINIEKQNSIEVITCKRMITKLTNALNYFETTEKAKLIPDWDNPDYQKLKDKIENYKERLKTAEEKKTENNSAFS